MGVKKQDLLKLITHKPERVEQLLVCKQCAQFVLLEHEEIKFGICIACQKENEATEADV